MLVAVPLEVTTQLLVPVVAFAAAAVQMQVLVRCLYLYDLFSILTQSYLFGVFGGEYGRKDSIYGHSPGADIVDIYWISI